MTHNGDMPKRNAIKQYVSQSYYHIYTRGVAKEPIFNSEEDYTVFVSLLKRYLSKETPKSPTRHAYPSYNNQLSLLAYCLMPNHFHLLVYQEDERAITDFMRSLMTSYSMYFNRVNKRVGPVFQSRYLASLVDSQSYLEHISRYIHLNPKDWKTTNKTSLDFYLNKRSADWIDTTKIMEIFDNDVKKYKTFLEDHQAHKKILDDLKWELADTE